MFAVNGWNLSSTAPRTQQPDAPSKKKKPSKKKTAKSASTSNTVPVSNKRNPEVVAAAIEAPVAPKNNGIVVTDDNVLALYEKVIEGKTEAKKKRVRGPKKGRKDTTEGEDTGKIESEDGKGKKRLFKEEGEEGSSTDGPPAHKKKKTLKEKRREKKAAVLAETTGESLSKILGADTNINASATASFKPTPTQPKVKANKPAAAPFLASVPTLTPLQQKMRQKLTSARFRHINETLYTTPSTSSLTLFQSQPEMYSEYHSGFRLQVEVWPENPVDIFIRTLQSRGKVKFSRGHNRKWNSSTTTESPLLPLPRDREEGWCTVADLGCGDAKIASTIKTQKPRGKSKIKVLSYDLQASTPDVTIADIAHLPLENESVDIAIFCLALMGTNFLEFIEEAHRILRPRGELWVAEIKSRFQRPTDRRGGGGGGGDGGGGGEEEDIIEAAEKKKGAEVVYKPFVEALSRRGFTLRGNVDMGNKMFVRMEFVKMPPPGRNNLNSGDGDGDGDGNEDPALDTGTGGGGRGVMWNEKGRGGGRGGGSVGGRKKSKFVEEDLREETLLKPCVYKLR